MYHRTPHKPIKATAARATRIRLCLLTKAVIVAPHPAVSTDGQGNGYDFIHRLWPRDCSQVRCHHPPSLPGPVLANEPTRKPPAIGGLTGATRSAAGRAVSYFAKPNFRLISSSHTRARGPFIVEVAMSACQPKKHRRPQSACGRHRRACQGALGGGAPFTLATSGASSECKESQPSFRATPIPQVPFFSFGCH